MQRIASINPAKAYQINGYVTQSSTLEICKKVKLANSTKKIWAGLELKERLTYVTKLRDIFFNNKKQIAQLITNEIGTPITESLDEVEWKFLYIDHFIKNAQKFLDPEIIKEDQNEVHYKYFESIGSSLVITPWNLPFDMFIWGVFPNLIVGNTVVYKPAEQCLLTNKFIEELCLQVKLPNGVLNFIYGASDVGKKLVDESFDLIWFTGSSQVGKEIFKKAGQKFVKSVLEMGGSNAAIVLKDADLEVAAEQIIVKRFSFCSQTCDAIKRVIVDQTVAPKLLKLLKAKMQKYQPADPQNPLTLIGPLASKIQLQTLTKQFNDAIAKGAQIEMRIKPEKGLKGAYFPTTLLSNINKNSKVWTEEVFGPILPIMTFKTEQEAIDLANKTNYGLGNAIYSKNQTKALEIAKKLESGNIIINGAGHFQPDIPFGGIKNSGMGREHGVEGFRELCNLKTISIKKS